MIRHPTASSDLPGDNSPRGQEIDYSPKTYSPRQQVIFGLKLFSIGGILLLLFWLSEVYIAR